MNVCFHRFFFIKNTECATTKKFVKVMESCSQHLFCAMFFKKSVYMKEKDYNKDFSTNASPNLIILDKPFLDTL
jgi:hypothetical protein